MTTRQIAEIFGVDKTCIIRWLKQAGISRRAANNGLLNRGQAVPAADELHQLIHIRHWSYEKIGELFRIDPGAVAYWLKKYAIPRPKRGVAKTHGASALLTETALKELYVLDKLSTTKIGNLYGVSGGCIARHLRLHDIEVRPGGWRQPFMTHDGTKVRSTYELHVANWLHENHMNYQYEPRLPFNLRMRSDFLVEGIYIEIWGVESSPIYNQRKAVKRKGYRENGLKLVELTPGMFQRGSWLRRLEKLLQHELFSFQEPSIP